MHRMIYDYTKSILEKVSHDEQLFRKELKKALRSLSAYEIEKLRNWLQFFTKNKPELQQCILDVNF
ncbi:MAG: hypothetical protein PHC28_14340 [Flavobacterium sp.]|uniref:hypothetical protein n=1 Tax=Flavobacterium sp. TaxID=239 RepID=UPI00261C842F|nr:hypothetical protein [Flavobacterium sp.]MDD5151633.1 hypothetical protein [Flavobacterium sp.]